MRIRLLLLASLLGGTPLPAAAQDMQALQRAWSACSAPQTAADVRISTCDTVIASDRVKDDLRALALVGRGFARIVQGDRAGGMADFDTSIRLSPTATAYAYRGSLRMSREELDAAVSDFDRAIELEPRNAEHHRKRGYAHAQRKDHQRAIADMTTVIDLSTEPDADNYIARAIEHERAGQNDKAIADYQRALEIDPDNNPARRFLAFLGGTPPESAKLPPGLCSGDADTTSHQDRITGCSEVIDSGALSGWTLKTAYCNRAYALTELGEFDRVIADSEALLKIDQNASCAYQNRGRAWYYKKDLDRAIADYTQAIKLEPKFAEAFASRGTAYHDRFEFDLAVADYDAALRIEPDAKDVQAWRANSLRMKQIYAAAIADMARDIELIPDNAERYRGRGDLYFARGDLDRAIADYTAAIKLAPAESTNLHARAQAYDRKNEPALAQADRAEADRRQFERFQLLVQQPRDTKP